MATISYQEAKSRLPDTESRGGGWIGWAVITLLLCGAVGAFTLGQIHGEQL